MILSFDIIFIAKSLMTLSIFVVWFDYDHRECQKTTNKTVSENEKEKPDEIPNDRHKNSIFRFLLQY